MSDAAFDYAPTELILAAQRGDTAAMEALLERNAGLLHAMIRRFSDRAARIGSDADDLFQLASIGFLKAVRQFDPALSYRFSTYAVPWIVGEIRRFLRDDGPVKVSRSVRETAGKIEAARELLKTRLGREPTISEVAEAVGLTPEEVAAQSNQMPVVLHQDSASNWLENIPDISQSEEQILERVAISSSLALLLPNEQDVIRLRYQHGLTQQKTADILGISQVQVSRVERRTLQKLRQLLT